MKQEKIYTPKTRELKPMDIIEKIILVCIMTAFTSAIIIGCSMIIILLTK